MAQKGYYITESGEQFEITPEMITIFGSLFLSNKTIEGNITKIVINESVVNLYCNWNKILKTLIISNVTHLEFVQSGIKIFVIPDSIQYIACDMMDGIEEQDRKDLDMKIYQSNYQF